MSYLTSVTSITVQAPANIALIKYWGKRDLKLNLPMTASLSITLNAKLGTKTTIGITENIKNIKNSDQLFFNQKLVSPSESFYQKVFNFIQPFRLSAPKFKNTPLTIFTENSIPTAAGVASSASAFAALTQAVNLFFNFNWDLKTQSQIARLGSGSACRSLFNHLFVHWHAGKHPDGSDCFAEAFYPNLDQSWKSMGLCLDILLIHTKPKLISSRDAMRITQETSKYYQTQWISTVQKNLKEIKTAILNLDFETLGAISERNALAMHATIEDSVTTPKLSFSLPETLKLRALIIQLRKEKNIPVFFTQDAGPNLKILYLKKDQEKIRNYLKHIDSAMTILEGL